MGDTPLWLLGLVAAPGLLALALGVYLWTMLRGMRATQRVLLPDGASASLLDTQSAVQRALRRLEDDMVEVKAGIAERTAVVDRALSRTIRFQGLVRYDAYRDMGGQQSWSIALVDEERNGTIITSLHARDHARVYMKEMRDGRSLQRLSPEEVAAVEAALGESVPGLQPEDLPEPAP